MPTTGKRASADKTGVFFRATLPGFGCRGPVDRFDFMNSRPMVPEPMRMVNGHRRSASAKESSGPVMKVVTRAIRTIMVNTLGERIRKSSPMTTIRINWISNRLMGSPKVVAERVERVSHVDAGNGRPGFRAGVQGHVDSQPEAEKGQNVDECELLHGRIQHAWHRRQRTRRFVARATLAAFAEVPPCHQPVLVSRGLFSSLRRSPSCVGPVSAPTFPIVQLGRSMAITSAC